MRQPDPDKLCRCNNCRVCGRGVYMELQTPETVQRDREKRQELKRPRKPIRWLECDHGRVLQGYNVKKLKQD